VHDNQPPAIELFTGGARRTTQPMQKKFYPFPSIEAFPSCYFARPSTAKLHIREPHIQLIMHRIHQGQKEEPAN
jgi:hypothetical protein